MTPLWQLKKLSTNEPLNDPQPLPTNWGPIFGLNGFKEKLGDLTWVGLPDQGWFEVGSIDETVEETKETIEGQIDKLLNESVQYVAADNLNVTKQQRAEWIEYRQKLKEMYLQPGYPTEVYWPKKPE